MSGAGDQHIEEEGNAGSAGVPAEEFRADRLAALLVGARRSGERLAGLDAALAPPDIRGAMDVQASVARILDESVAGWKVGRFPSGPAAAPIFRTLVAGNSATWVLPSRGIVGIEVEIAFRLGRDLAALAGSPPSRIDVLSAADSTLAGIEIVESRFADFTKVPFPAHLADNLASGGYVTGSGQPGGGPEGMAACRCRVEIDGNVVFDGANRHPDGDPVLPVAAYAAAPADLLGGLCAGQIVTTGNLCGLIPITGACRVVAVVEGIGTVALEFV